MMSNQEATIDTHRISNARHGQVACYCSAFEWMTLDEYGEHVETIVNVQVSLAYGHGFSAGHQSATDVECTCGHYYSDHPCSKDCGCADG